MGKLGCVEITVTGIVQGVGFRPFVYRLARELSLQGEVANTEDGVVIRAQGQEEVLEDFIKRLGSDAPPLAQIKGLKVVQRPCIQFEGFTIRESSKKGHASTGISPDIATCSQCQREIFDPKDRRFGYPFTNCTNCGPRFTIVESIPYDRSATSMKVFKMCKKCLDEYNDPANRRFHAQPNACPECGPSLSFRDVSGTSRSVVSPLKEVARYLGNHKIVAIKGLGGFHLACSAYSARAISTLRQRKSRPFKPLALMVRDIGTAKSIGVVDEATEKLLLSPQAPIVIVPRRKGAQIAEEVAPNISDIGIMLPYTPLHHLLFDQEGCPDALVMTSGNPKDEPLCTQNDEAVARLGAFVHGFLLHNRDIYTGVDDSVLRQSEVGPLFIRRSRGYVPAPVDLGCDVSGILATGGELKNTFCLTRNGSAYLSQHIGNLVSAQTFDFYRRNIDHLASLLELDIGCCACDLHPDYLGTQYAQTRGVRTIRVQHHFAHAASVMAEHRLKGPLLALCLDGTGLGTDGTIWGGEILICTSGDFKRVGRIRPFLLPGGDASARSPWRSLLSIISAVFGKDKCDSYLPEVDGAKRAFVAQMVEKRVNCPVTSSCGRLFDAVAALCGLCMENTYEAQAALELESLASKSLGSHVVTGTEEFEYFLGHKGILRKSGGLLELDWQPFFELSAPIARESQGETALLFHAFLVAGLSRLVHAISRDTNISDVVISGGCAQNRILLRGFMDYFLRNGLRCYKNQKVPANDGGLCLGQAFVAANLLSK
ncbi:MAG: carbamoyltransferase HypF [Thermodesulfobacteria bacterium]|nr:carbamoyltransferase HypF [Thermodesulfobacteriota bacterium]